MNYNAELYLPEGGEGYESVGGAPAPRNLNDETAGDRVRRQGRRPGAR